MLARDQRRGFFGRRCVTRRARLVRAAGGWLVTLLAGAVPGAQAADEPAAPEVVAVEGILFDEASESEAPAVAPVEVVEPAPEVMGEVRRPSAGAAASKWIGGADFLLLRPSFSNSTAMLSNTRSGGLVGLTPVSSSLDAINYDFGYSGGVRGFLGYQATPDHVFRFTYMNYFTS